jgi:hypothetical protein
MSIQQEHKDYYLICDNCTKEIGLEELGVVLA